MIQRVNLYNDFKYRHMKELTYKESIIAKVITPHKESPRGGEWRGSDSATVSRGGMG
jgi:hypothetical protein